MSSTDIIWSLPLSLARPGCSWSVTQIGSFSNLIPEHDDATEMTEVRVVSLSDRMRSFVGMLTLDLNMEDCSESLTEHVSDSLMNTLFTSKRNCKFKALLQALYLHWTVCYVWTDCHIQCLKAETAYGRGIGGIIVA